MNRMTKRAKPPHRILYQSGVKDSRGWSEKPSVTESSCVEEEESLKDRRALVLRSTLDGEPLVFSRSRCLQIIEDRVRSTEVEREEEEENGSASLSSDANRTIPHCSSPCPDCAAKDKMIKVPERQLAELKAATPQPVRVSEESDGRASCNACGAALQGPFYQCRESKAWKLCSNCGGREKFCNAKGEFDHVFQNKRVNS